MQQESEPWNYSLYTGTAGRIQAFFMSCLTFSLWSSPLSSFTVGRNKCDLLAGRIIEVNVSQGVLSKMEGKTSLLDNMIGVGDMVLLEPLSEESFIENLKKRFDHNEIYTYIGSVVISMNPYKSLPIYTAEKVEEYRNRNFYELSPHM
ncbi:Unconventional myosin-Ib [Labeo rohita]|uniref:Unconventional myosin-Ib n=1 Tax=Labeo rohita TaxID=84645 RepID=A0ABQ8MC07_LABRO|nr:Unconventional myosin-Ib [Labeo rohita]